MKKLIIMRGLPGAGKSTWIREHYPEAVVASEDTVKGSQQVICSADHWFERTGTYVWNPEELPRAHGRCKFLAKEAMKNRSEVVLIDNTNTRPRDWKAYTRLADQFGYEVEFVRIFDGGLSDQELADRGKHNVPVFTIAKMRSRWFDPETPRSHRKN